MLVVAATKVCLAKDINDLARENARLKQRVERLEKQLEELRKIVMQQAKTPEAEPRPAPVPKLRDSDLQKIAAMVPKSTTEKKPVWSNLDIELYGYIKLDASYDTSRTNPGNYVVWVDSEETNRDDDEFNITANQTRLGLKITGPDDGEMKTSGLLEFDFFGDYAAENKAKIQMRHGYLKIDWPQDNFSILAGQTSDVISPLCPSTLNYTVLWDAGNIGYRRPQVRLTKGFELDGDTEFELQGALARTIGDDELSATPGAKSGEDSGFPSLQGRAGLTFPWFGSRPTSIGVSGHWAEEEYNSKDVDSWSVNLDLAQPINKWLTVKGEFFTGENLDSYFGGIGQGVNTTKNYKEIGSTGGWIAASLGPCGKWSFNLGVGMDDVDADDVNADERTLNRSIFGNVIYSLNKNTKIGFELSQWHTERKDQGNADSLRAQTSFIYSF